MSHTESTWLLKLPSLGGKVIWTGSVRASPDIPTLSRIIPADIDADDLTAITVQVLNAAPIESIPTLLTALCSVYLRSTTGVIDVNALSTISATEHRMVCGRVFKKGDIVWNCRTCGKDPTCVQCDPCFRKANHTGHEVYFHRAEGGSGCCDCGDPEAWASHGNCTDHQPRHDQETYDPAQNLPEQVKKGFRAVLQGCFGWISSFTVLSVRSFENITENLLVRIMRQNYPTTSAVLRIHNDDVHTYGEVIQAFKSLGFNDNTSQNLTKQVDKDGSAIILNTLISNEQLVEFHETIRNAGLLCSILPVDFLPFEKRVPCVLTWLITLGEFSDGFRRLITEELLRNTSDSDIPTCVGHMSTIHSWPELAQSFTLQTMFNEEGQFPLEITQLSPIEFLTLPFSARISTTTSLAGKDTTTAATTKGSASSNPSLTIFSTAEEELKDRIRRPFRYVAANPLSLLLLASPFLNISVQKVLMEIIMKFQHDFLFKCGFSQLVTILYPSLAVLFCRHYGLAQETILKTTVQVYTANSIAELMSSLGIAKRPVPEIGFPTSQLIQPMTPRYVLITNMLMSVFFTILKDMGCPNNPEFLNHHSIRTHRLSMICRDLEYVTSDPYYCIELLRGRVNPGTVSYNRCTFL